MKIILADKSHDVQLRDIVRAETMPGHIEITYEREPDFFHGLETQGTFNQVVASEESGRISGFGCRSIRPMFVNGERISFGYLSGLRSTVPAKRVMAVVRGYKALRELHRDGRCPGYITTIIEGNNEAFSTIAQGRAGLPFYKDLGLCRTYVIALNRFQRSSQGNITTRFARAEDLPQLIRFLNKEGGQYQFFPSFRETDFTAGILRNVSVENFILAEKEGVVCGVGAIWDQTAFKQHRIKRYSRSMQLAGHLVNMALRIGGFSSLPKPGNIVNSSYYCFKAVQNNAPEIHAALLNHACCRLRKEGFSHCITGFHSSDPVNEIMKSYICTTYRSRMFFVGWQDDLETFHRLDGRTPCFEPAIL